MAFGYEDELKAEIARLRDALDEQTGRAVWNYDCLTQCEERVIQRDAEIARLRLTDAEREALERLCEAASDVIADDKRAGGCHWQDDAAAVAAARGLLERLGGGR